MKANVEQAALLDRGGHPTLRELLDRLVFSPANGHINLGGARMVLQRASYGRHLRDELIQELGHDEAYILISRLGFRAGAEDAEFVRTSWPFLDLGDAFTAGTRMHSIEGIVRVETVFNDFDFEKGKFAAEFLWHDSAEATQHLAHHGKSRDPVCWGLIAYASGYASYYLDKLIVYKETQCVGCGHTHCRIFGKPAEIWGKNDEFVRLYEQQIAPRQRNPASRVRAEGRIVRPIHDLDDFDASPQIPEAIRQRLDRAALTEAPLFISGPGGSGRTTAARYVHDMSAGPQAQFEIMSCGHLTYEEFVRKFSPRAGRLSRSSSRRTIVLDDIELLPDRIQLWLADHLASETAARDGTRLMATSTQSLAALTRRPGLRAGLVYRLAVMAVHMPPLRAWRGEMSAISRAVLGKVARKHDRRGMKLSSSAIRYLAAQDFPGNFWELEAVLTAAVLETDGSVIDEGDLRARHGRDLASTYVDSEDEHPLGEQIAHAIAESSMSLRQINGYALKASMRLAKGNVAEAARLLGITRAQLAYRLGNNGRS